MAEDTISKGNIDQIPLGYLRDFDFLTPGQAIIVYLVDECGLNYGEVGRKIGRKSYNIERQHQDANKKISQMYEKMLEQERNGTGIFANQE